MHVNLSIYRCVVCETSTRVIALHSQSMSIPDCPGGWEEMWTGYSYLMVSVLPPKFYKITFILILHSQFQTTNDNTGGFGQNLVSPGSCLEEFRSQPVIECHGQGRCNFYDPVASFWMAVIEESEMWQMPRPATLKADQTSKISR